MNKHPFSGSWPRFRETHAGLFEKAKRQRLSEGQIFVPLVLATATLDARAAMLLECEAERFLIHSSPTIRQSMLIRLTQQAARGSICQSFPKTIDHKILWSAETTG